MTIMDFIVIIIAAIALVTGLFKGFLKQCFGVIVLILSVMLTAAIYTAPMAWLEGVIPSEGTRRLAALVATFVVVFALLKLLSVVLTKVLTNVAAIKVVDKVLGAVFGVFIVYVLVGVVLALILNTPDNVMYFSKQLFKSPLEEMWLSQHVYAKNPIGKWLVEWIGSQLQVSA